MNSANANSISKSKSLSLYEEAIKVLPGHEETWLTFFFIPAYLLINSSKSILSETRADLFCLLLILPPSKRDEYLPRGYLIKFEHHLKSQKKAPSPRD